MVTVYIIGALCTMFFCGLDGMDKDENAPFLSFVILGIIWPLYLALLFINNIFVIKAYVIKSLKKVKELLCK